MRAITTGILTLASCVAVSHASAAQKPNVIVIYIDDMGIGDLGCFGGDITSTPNIDKFAAQGLRLTQYYSASLVSSPSRVAITTGQFPINYGINTYLSSRKHNSQCEQRDYLDADAPSMARAFQNAGYHTASRGERRIIRRPE